MDLALGIIFLIIAFLFFIIALFEERDPVETDDEAERSDNLVVIFLVVSCLFFIFGGICLMFVSETYYSVVTDTVEEVLMGEYRPFGYAAIIFSFVPGLMATTKVFDVLGSGEAEE